MPPPQTVVVENKTAQMVAISVTVDGVVTEAKLLPHGAYGPVLFVQLTAYTRRLAELGRVFIRAQN